MTVSAADFDRLIGRDWKVVRVYTACVADQIARAPEILVDELPKVHDVGSPRCRAITMRCTSLVPSPISRIFWSR